jgi:hypothetical protein
MNNKQIGSVRSMNTFSRTVGAVAVALATAGAVTTQAEEAINHSLQAVGTNSLAIGALYSSDITNVSFRVVNRGKGPVIIERLKPTCSCTTGTASTNPVVPGGEAVITLRFDPNTIKGAFDRGVWVVTDDAETPYLKLMLTGTVKPLFSGVDEKPVSIIAQEVGTPVTNRFTLVAAGVGILLGSPTITTNGALRMQVMIATNMAGTATYEITTVATSLGLGRQTAEIKLPVIGRPTAEPLVIRFMVVNGLELSAIPNRFNFSLDNEPQTFRVILRGKTAEMDPAAFTCAPPLEGVTVTAVKGRRPSELLVRIEVSPKGAEALYLSKDASLHVGYPGHMSATVTFANTAETDEKSRSRPNRMPSIFSPADPDSKKKFRF